jgi:hypothetical protein
VRFLEYLPIRIDPEAGRSHPRRSQKVLEVYSPLALNLVRKPTSLPSHPRGAIIVSSWLVVWVNIV